MLSVISICQLTFCSSADDLSDMSPTHTQSIGVRGMGGTCPPKIREKYLSGNSYVRFGHFSGKNHVKFGNFVNFSGKYHKNSGILIIFWARIMYM